MNFLRKISKSLNSAVIANLNAIARRLSSWRDCGCLKKNEGRGGGERLLFFRYRTAIGLIRTAFKHN
jgi:hypothetical protein